jgi:hypothetical protein
MAVGLVLGGIDEHHFALSDELAQARPTRRFPVAP